MIIGGDKRFTIQVQIRGSNRLANGQRKNTVKQITVLDSTVDEVEKVVREALQRAATESQAEVSR